MKSIKLLTIALGLSAASSLFALPVDYSAAIDGLTPSGATMSATGGTLVLGDKNGVKFAGVTGGSAGTEIDLDQSVIVNFNDAVEFGSLTLGLLFNGPEYNDNLEIAASLTNGVGGDLFELRLTGQNAADWYMNNVFQSSVIGVGTSVSGVGSFTIWNPFGSLAVTSLELKPLPVLVNVGSNSDFGLVAYTASTVPDAGATIALLGAALLGVAGFARRSRRA